LAIYQQRGITNHTRHSDWFSMKEDLAVIMDHERKKVKGTSKSLAEEFIKRFLIIFLCTDGYSNRYTDRDGQLCAINFFVRQGNVLQSLMYFCIEKEDQSGIWMFNHLLTRLRAAAASDCIEYVNYQIHQSYTKKCAGDRAAEFDDSNLMDALYPFRFFEALPDHIIQLKLGLPNQSKDYPVPVPVGGNHRIIQGTIVKWWFIGMHASLIYGESLMTVLHVWILLGVALPSLESVTKQPLAMTYGCLASDLMLPILATSLGSSNNSQGTTRTPLVIQFCIAAHTLMYQAFLFDMENMSSVMEWTYSSWATRKSLQVGSGFAVVLDAVCHSWGLLALLRQGDVTRDKVASSLVGATVGVYVMLSLANV
jgi:hypothetical protein